MLTAFSMRPTFHILEPVSLSINAESQSERERQLKKRLDFIKMPLVHSFKLSDSDMEQGRKWLQKETANLQESHKYE